MASPALAETQLRVATWSAPLSRDGPGLLLRDILADDDPQIAAILAVLTSVSPDVLVLTEFDYDAGLVALGALADRLEQSGQTYAYRFALKPNSGQTTGLDMDGNGRTGEPRDAMGYGRFSGDGGMAILSRLPIDPQAVTDLSDVLWRDLPGATLPTVDGNPFPSPAAQDIQRLSTTGHWIVPISLPDGTQVSLLTSSATPPVFDGPEDLNGLRNRDELHLWTAVLDGVYGPAPASFVLAANTNLDPEDGDGYRDAMARFLADLRLQDPKPTSIGGGTDTADWPDDGPGNLRVSYVLPSIDWRVTGSGVFWPAQGDPLAGLLGSDGAAAGPHHLVWVDIAREAGQ